MVTKAVSMDVKLGSSNRTRPQDGGGDSGFSDVLGSVGKDSGRKQQGLSERGGDVQRGREFGKEFRFTEKASSRPVNGDGGRQPGTQGSSSSFDSVGPMDAQAADEILSEAAQAVVQLVRETGEKPTKEEAAEMLAEALGALKSGEDKEEVPEDTLIDALMQVFTEIADGTAAAAAVVTNEAPVTDDIPLTAGIAEKPAEMAAAMPEELPDTAVRLTADEESAGDFAAELGNVLDDALGSTREETADGSIYEEIPDEPFDPGLKAFIGDSVQKLADGRLSVEAAVSDFEPEPEIEADVLDIPKPDFGEMTVSDTVKLLADLLEEAKDKLGLSELKVEHVYEGDETPVPMMRGDNSQLSHRMFSKDGTGELDHILNGTRFDVSEDDDSTDTETYDAVRMASQLMESRTDTDIPVENEPMFPERTQISPPEVQTAEQILERIEHMQDDHTEFTMVLNPEALGRITVKIAAAGERISVEITAEDPKTGAMLASRNEGLQNLLRESGVQLEKCQVVSEHEDTQFNQQSYDGSSKNPYGRNDEEDRRDNDDDGDGESFYDLLQSL